MTAASCTDANGNTTNRVIYTATVTIDGVPYTNTVVEYGLFAGWYKDAACTEAYTSQPGANDAKYAKLVDPAVLTVKYQLKNPTYPTDTSSRMRIVTTVDSLEYASVGFALTYTKPSDGTVVYGTARDITASGSDSFVKA